MGNIDYLIKIMPVGISTLVLGKVNDEENAIFVVKEEEKYINKIPEEAIINLRTLGIDSNNVLVIVFLYKLNKNEIIYENYLNIYDTSDGMKIFNSLMKQNNIIFVFHSMNSRKRTIMAKNDLKNTLENIKKRVEEYAPWTMGQFNEAKNRIQETYSVEDLWNYARN
ncbi:MAG: hypothetical protein ACP5T9_06495 [Thermoplasmata archaeon]